MLIIIAIIPLIVALVALAILQRSGLQAGLATALSAIVLTLLIPAFRLTPDKLILSIGEGFATSLTVLYVLLPALFLYQVLRISEGIDVLSRGIRRLCPDRDTQFLLLALGLAPFVESVSGFGVGTVVVIPMFIALGISTVEAAALGLLGQIAVPWGALAVGIVLGAQLTHLNANQLSAYTALITIPLPVGFGFAALALGGGKRAISRLWPAAVLAGLLLVAGEWFFSLLVGAELTGVLATLPVIALLALWGHLIHRSGTKESSPSEVTEVQATQAIDATHQPTLLQAIAPYLLLTVLLLLSRLIPALSIWLQTYGVLIIPAIDLQLALLYSPGCAILFASLAAIVLLHIDSAKLRLATARTIQQFTPGALAIISFLVASQVMRLSGMISVLASAAATLGTGYSWIAPWLAALGGWLTGSNAGGNAMFAQLQRDAGTRAGLPLYWLMAAQNGASSIATMISPARIILAVVTAGILGKEGFLLRRVGPLVLAAIAVIMCVLVGIVLL